MSQHDWDGKGQRHVWRKQWADPAVVILRGARRRASGCRLTWASHQKIWTEWGRLTEGPCQRSCSALFIVPANTFAVSEKIDRKNYRGSFPRTTVFGKNEKKVKKRYQRCYPVFADMSKVKQSRLQEGPSMCHIPICWKFHQKHHGRELAGQANQHVQNGPFGFLTAIGDSAMLPIGSCLVI